MYRTSGFSRFANWTARAAGHPMAFALAAGVVLAWLVTGPIFGFSDTWQLVINTGTTIVTFLMVFLIQNTQNRDSEALHLKVDELLRATTEAHTDYADIEDLTERELKALHERFKELGLHGDETPAPGEGSHATGSRSSAAASS